MVDDRVPDAVARLVRAARATELEPPLPATGGTAGSDAVEAAIAPLRLPTEVRTLWRLLQPHSVYPTPYAAFTDPVSALQSWRMHLEFPGTTPRLLFPVAYQSHSYLFVELHDERQLGGAIFSWGYCGSPFSLQHVRLSDYLHHLAQMWERREYERTRLPDGRIHGYVDGRLFRQQAADRLAAGPAHPVYGRQTSLEEEVAQWPEHWLAAEGGAAADRRPKGRTASIGELAAAAPHGTASGTIHALVMGLASSGAGVRVTVDDGTGVLDLWCRAPVTMFGPVISKRFEFDVAVDSARPPPDDAATRLAVQDAAGRGDLGAAQQEVAELYRLYDQARRSGIGGIAVVLPGGLRPAAVEDRGWRQLETSVDVVLASSLAWAVNT